MARFYQHSSSPVEKVKAVTYRILFSFVIKDVLQKNSSGFGTVELNSSQGREF